jgi:hypothetical protein
MIGQATGNKKIEVCLFFLVFAVAIFIATAVVVFFFKNHNTNLLRNAILNLIAVSILTDGHGNV